MRFAPAAACSTAISLFFVSPAFPIDTATRTIAAGESAINARSGETSDVQRVAGNTRVRRGNGPLDDGKADADPSPPDVADPDNAGVAVPLPAPVTAEPALPPVTPVVQQPRPPHPLFDAIKRIFDTQSSSTLRSFDEADRKELRAFYERRGGEPVWVGDTGFNATAEALTGEVRRAEDFGLRAKDYLLPVVRTAAGTSPSGDALAEAEIKLSLVAMEYARHARGDRIDQPATQLSSYLDRKPQLMERGKFLDGLAAAPDKADFLRSLHPKHPQFERLRQKLLEIRAGKNAVPAAKFPFGKPLLPGKRDPQVAMLRQRLNVPVLPVPADMSPMDEMLFDQAVADAVIAFKISRDIEPANAAVNDATRRALNQSDLPDERAILANMEEWRWMPEDLGATHIEVNIPEFMVRVVKDGSVIHSERIVSGRIDTQTPVFTDMMRTVVFQPVWNVPESIKIKELLPGMQNGRNTISGRGLVMERNGRKIDPWSIDWSRADIRFYHIYQPPGDSNALGVVKFLFPNKHSVYLHDTPSKSLFNEKVRAFSHGCMRVRNPVRLAEVILAEDKNWDKDKIADLISSGPENNEVPLDKPLPVHVTYFTLNVDDNGTIKSFADIYGHEQRIKLGLEGRWNEIEKNRDHLLPPSPRNAWRDLAIGTMTAIFRASAAAGGKGKRARRKNSPRIFLTHFLAATNSVWRAAPFFDRRKLEKSAAGKLSRAAA